jgi:hypothetical protein
MLAVTMSNARLLGFLDQPPAPVSAKRSVSSAPQGDAK